MSDIPVWNCEFFALKDEPTLGALTVGAKFGWKCHGDIAVQWEPSPPRLAYAKPEDAYTLTILKVIRQDPNDAQYEVTAYKAGDHKPEYIRVLQNQGSPTEKGFEATAPKWDIKSVLDPKQPPQAFGPFGPWQLSLPIWFIVAIVLVLTAVILMIVRRTRKYSQRRRMLEELKLHKTALLPLHQFYRDARYIRRRLNGVKDPSELKAITSDLDREFRLYVLRQFQIPALDWSNRAILEDLRKHHRKTYRAAGDSLKKTLRELEKLKARPEMDLKDIEQLHSMSLAAAEKLNDRGGHA